MNLEFIAELNSQIALLEANPDIRGMILSSGVKGTFSAGWDITELKDPDEQRLAAFWTALQDLYLRLYLSPLYTIAVVEGHAPAAGCLLALCCDFRIMEMGAGNIGLNEARAGMCVPAWFKDTYVNTIGFRHAEHMLMQGTQVDAGKAKVIGLVDEITAPGHAQEHALQEMKEALCVPDSSRIQTKHLMRLETADKLQSNRKKDLEDFVKFAKLQSTQQRVDSYLNFLSSKRKN